MGGVGEDIVVCRRLPRRFRITAARLLRYFRGLQSARRGDGGTCFCFGGFFFRRLGRKLLVHAMGEFGDDFLLPLGADQSDRNRLMDMADVEGDRFVAQVGGRSGVDVGVGVLEVRGAEDKGDCGESGTFGDYGDEFVRHLGSFLLNLGHFHIAAKWENLTRKKCVDWLSGGVELWL
jgi:hypothetical protein